MDRIYRIEIVKAARVDASRRAGNLIFGKKRKLVRDAYHDVLHFHCLDDDDLCVKMYLKGHLLSSEMKISVCSSLLYFQNVSAHEGDVEEYFNV